ncbi:TIGR00730 family Rossman fold protein [Aliidiomarina sanyensis]|uniref:Cytokinin riboside 5'-monophosphate phosphoribohydrolase n=1 Tax=Aliidiomarina sanyensis TaxID=1249555 RepID=A0A432WDK3_9GAMM|nr:TIGR00730 family Rossman fold protein [Aliidiomarina sanyensis]RUO30478.1 TIGR00730 family Rossman fold protein [Aliidiomarina sanyensis]
MAKSNGDLPLSKMHLTESVESFERTHAEHLSGEWMTAEKTFNTENVKHTISIFGSARIPDPSDCTNTDPCLDMAQYYADAREISKRIGAYIESNQMIHTRLITGGGPGIMEAASRGAYDAGHNSIGLNIVIPREQRLNPFIAAKHSIEFQYFALRKMHFLKRARALIVFPGGFGTLDELFETLTLIQTGKMPRIPIFVYGKQFWDRLLNVKHLARTGMIDEKDLALYHMVDSVDEAWEWIAPILADLHAEYEAP